MVASNYVTLHELAASTVLLFSKILMFVTLVRVSSSFATKKFCSSSILAFANCVLFSSNSAVRAYFYERSSEISMMLSRLSTKDSDDDTCPNNAASTAFDVFII